MKKAACFLGLLLAAFVPASHAQTSVGFTWQANPAWATTWPACSTTVTTMCLTGFTLTDTTGATPVVVSSTIPASALSYTLSPLPAAGLRTYTLVANGKDQTGNPAISTTDTTTVTVPSATPPPPQAFAATP